MLVGVSIAEPPVFKRALETQTRARDPFFDTVRTYLSVLLLSSCGMTLAYVLFYTTTFSLSYGTPELGLPSTTLPYCTMIAVALMGLGVPVFAAFSDRTSRRSLCLWAAALAALWAFPLFRPIDTGNPLLIALSFPVGTIIFDMFHGPWGRFSLSSTARGCATAGSPPATTSAASSGAPSRPDRGPAAGLDGGFLVDLALRPGDGRREIRKYIAALGNPPEGPRRGPRRSVEGPRPMILGRLDGLQERDKSSEQRTLIKVLQTGGI